MVLMYCSGDFGLSKDWRLLLEVLFTFKIVKNCSRPVIETQRYTSFFTGFICCMLLFYILFVCSLVEFGMFVLAPKIIELPLL